jgi:hypothetical protein
MDLEKQNFLILSLSFILLQIQHAKNKEEQKKISREIIAIHNPFSTSGIQSEMKTNAYRFLKTSTLVNSYQIFCQKIEKPELYGTLLEFFLFTRLLENLFFHTKLKVVK